MQYCVCGYLLVEEENDYVCIGCKKRTPKSPSPQTPRSPREIYNFGLKKSDLKKSVNINNENNDVNMCPECDSLCYFNSGCRSCVCGWSACHSN